MDQTSAFIRATGGLIESLIARLDPEEIKGLSSLIAAGAMLQVQSAWSRAGHVETQLWLIHPDGTRDELAALELSEPRRMPS